MLVYLVIIICIIFLGMNIAKKDEFYKDYMSVESTKAINGLFTLLVFISHASGYIKLSGPLDAPYVTFQNYMSQLVVTSFLFYSGFGIMESIDKKGMIYIKELPLKRFFRVLLHMDIAVLMYVILNLILGRTMELKNTLLAFTTWTSVGNSNWYITAVLALYICVFLAFMISRGNKYIGTLLTTILAVAFIILQIKLKRPSYCYNTIMLFPAGMLFSLIKNRFDQIVTKNDAIYLTGAIGVLGAYLVFFSKRFAGVTFYSIWGILFMALIVMISLKVKVNNNILQWFGSHVFSVYMLQRIPMIVLSHFGFALRHRYAFIAISFAATIVLAYLFDLAIEKIDSLIFLRRKEQQSEKAV